ncbi:MAG: peptidylprolyl isomerase [Rhizobiaceae bacterium]|nr:peptidylprolyl isomerase [Rhizobiaceae bacterium]MCV0408356.1 peptidylprolyl isomerase [Rhizobiaceae bacterium]
MAILLSRATLVRIGLASTLALAVALGALAQETQPADPRPDASEAAPEPADPSTVVATIDGEDVTEGDLALATGELDQQFQQLPAEQRRVAALSALIEIRLLAAEAEKKGLADDEEFQRRMTFLRQRALHSAMVESEVAKGVTDEAVRARYDEEVAGVPAENEVRARHILVDTKEEAEAIIDELDKGGDFEEIAKEKSGDPGSGAKGGDLGYFGRGQMVPEFEKAAFSLDVGAHTEEPVESQFGWHVIKLEDKRAKQPPAFDAVREQVRGLVLRDNYFDMVTRYRDEAEIDISDPELKAAFDQMNAAETPEPEEQEAPAEEGQETPADE